MNYYNEIELYIKKNEINKASRKLTENNEIILTYWNIGRLIIEAQGGESRAKYSNELIKNWSIQLTQKYGKGYNFSSLKRFRQFYIFFKKGAPLAHQLHWSHIQEILPIKDENKRNYYINLCIKNSLSKRRLRQEIKNNSYERLINKPDIIEITPLLKKQNIIDNIKNPIIIELNANEQINNEHDLEILLLAKLKSFFNQLGDGFALVENQYKINHNNKNYFIDLLLFNINFNCYIVVELKIRELKKEDKSQVEFYMNLIDTKIKKEFHRKTIGIIITKEQDKFIANFVGDNDIITLTYKTISIS